MKMTDASISICEPLRSVVETRATPDALTAAGDGEDMERQRQWQELIDRTLIEWGRDPSFLADDEGKAPSTATIQRACLLAKSLADEGRAPPMRVVPTVDGGIAFERKIGSVFDSIEVSPDGRTIELRRFVNSRLVSEDAIPFAMPL